VKRAICLAGKFTTDTAKLHESVYQDIIPMRLLSPETKTFSGDEDTNPTFGKGYQLGKEIQWYTGDPAKKSLALALFAENLAEFGDHKILSALPREYGGFGFVKPTTDELDKVFPPCVKQALSLTKSSDRTSKKFGYRVLALLRQPILLKRGRAVPLAVQENPLFDLLQEFLPFCTVEQAAEAAECPYRKFSHKVAFLKSNGWVSSEELEAKQGAQSFWEEAASKPMKGWKTATLDKRLEAIQKSLEQAKLAKPEAEEWKEAMEKPEFPPQSDWIRVDDLVVATELGAIPLNLQGKSTSLSLSMQIPNRNMFEINAWEEPRETQGSPKRRRYA
jgi:hypothetical protein